MLIIIGSLVLLSPFSGLPMSILTWILPALGAVALAIGISYKREAVLTAASPTPDHEASLSSSA
jgi:hypothetical protein